MSRRRGEFEHRTSIFEGAFRAWSHLGGLDPEDLESMPSSDLDPLTNPTENDSRMIGKKSEFKQEALNPNGTKRRIYPYEPLPRSGLAHPYVQAILSPWLGPDADNDAIQLGLTTLRTWWQHRRKGESGSAIAALGTEKMKGVVEGYTRHFFTLSHCLVMNDKEQPPRSLHGKMKELEKIRNKRNKKRNREEEEGKVPGMAMPSNNPNSVAAGIAADLTNKNLTPLERLHVAQQRQLAVEGGIRSTLPQINEINPVIIPIINIKNKCVPGMADLPAIVDAVSRRASQLAHSGANMAPDLPPTVPSAVVSGTAPSPASSQYGDPDLVPIVFVSVDGDVLLAMQVDGITCAHCVKIVETVLKGCNGNKSPIDGLLDAAADRVLCSVLIQIDKTSNAKRIAFEAARNLAMVGYSAKTKEMSLSITCDGKKQTMDIDSVYKAFDDFSQSDHKDVFDWSIPCSCPDNGVLRDDCSRHGQMSTHIFDSFESRAMLVNQYLSGAKMEPPPAQSQRVQEHQQPQQQMQPRRQSRQQPQQMMNDDFQPQPIMQNNNNNSGMAPMDAGMGRNGGRDFFGGSSGMGGNMNMGSSNGIIGLNDGPEMVRERAQRNPSIISFGGGRNMSFASEASYGRAMSGLSALSIDWENMDDFDINVDHSAHINIGMNSSDNLGGNDGILDPSPIGPIGGGPGIGGGGGGARRSSLRQPFIVGGGNDNDPHVSFKV
jgi:copper chaperone CopZ